MKCTYLAPLWSKLSAYTFWLFLNIPKDHFRPIQQIRKNSNLRGSKNKIHCGGHMAHPCRFVLGKDIVLTSFRLILILLDRRFDISFDIFGIMFGWGWIWIDLDNVWIDFDRPGFIFKAFRDLAGKHKFVLQMANK